jgi:hypothetical protein
MELMTILEQRRDSVLSRWLDLIIATYPPESARILGRTKDRFRNPIGYSISKGIEGVFDQFVGAMDAESLRSALDETIRVRAVQDFTPSEAVAFVVQLKSVIREVLEDQIDGHEHGHTDDLAELDSRIDRITLLAFDVFVDRREKFHEIRASEIKKSSIRLLERLNQTTDTIQNKGEPADDVGPKP